MPSVASAAGSISINEINSMIPAANPSENPSKRFEGFCPITPKMAPIKVALPASRVKMTGEDNIHLLMKIILIKSILIH